MRANRAGRIAEDTLASVMKGAGFVFGRQVVIGRTIYDTALRVDFIVRNIERFPEGLIVESKWQDVGGSVDEKFPYLVENIRQRYPLPTIVILHGGGCRDGAARWLHAHCDGERLVAVFGLEEFISWALRSKQSPNRSPSPNAETMAEHRRESASTSTP